MTWEDLTARGIARRAVELSPLTTYKLGGPADLYVEVVGPDVLGPLAEAMSADPVPTLILGRGSNLLIADGGFRGVVVRLSRAFTSLSIDDDGLVTAGGALSLPQLARAASRQGRGGLEWCVGVPGSVGGAVRQNAGCFGSEVVDVLVDADIVSLANGRRGTFEAHALDLSYRHSAVTATDLVVSARFRTVATDPEKAAGEMKRATRWRRDHQPGGTLNAGSVFKNPPGDAAGAIIDRLGLKGFSVGRVRVSPRHANFVEAEAGASASEVHALIEAVRGRVEDETGICLEMEIQLVGFGSED